MGFIFFVATAYVAYYKNTPMKLVYVAGTIIGASVGHRMGLWFESQSALAKSSMVTRSELAALLSLEFDRFFAEKIAHLEERIIKLDAKVTAVYSRMLRKLRTEMQWVKDTFATKAELEALRSFVSTEIARVQPVPAFGSAEIDDVAPVEYMEDRSRKMSAEQQKRNEICNRLHPPDRSHKKNKPSRKWTWFDRAGQARLTFERGSQDET